MAIIDADGNKLTKTNKVTGAREDNPEARASHEHDNKAMLRLFRRTRMSFSRLARMERWTCSLAVGLRRYGEERIYLGAWFTGRRTIQGHRRCGASRCWLCGRSGEEHDVHRISADETFWQECDVSISRPHLRADNLHLIVSAKIASRITMKW